MTDLQKLSTDLGSWYWWTTVVFVGFAINLASAYLKAPIDTLLARWSSRRAKAAKLRSEEINAQAYYLASHPTNLALEIRGETLSLLLAIFLLVLAAVMLIVNSILLSMAVSPSAPIRVLKIALHVPPVIIIIVSLRFMAMAVEHAIRLNALKRRLSAA